MLRQLFSDSSVIETSMREPPSKEFRPANLDEGEQRENHASVIPKEGSLREENSTKAEEINISGEEPIKSTSNNSVSPPYSMSYKKDTPSGKPSETLYTASSIFTFTGPLDSTANNNNRASSSMSDSGVVIKPTNLFLENRHSPAWPNALSRPSSTQSPPPSASLIAEATSSSYPHHVHHLHHRPFHLHHYCNSPINPTTKDVTVKLSPQINPPNVRLNNVLGTTTQVLHTVKEVPTSLPASNSNLLHTSLLSNQTPVDQISHLMNPVVSTDIMSSSTAPKDDIDANTTPSDSFIKNNP